MTQSLSDTNFLRTADVSGGPSLLQRAAGLMASEWLQPFWETVEKISSRGRGYSNIHPDINGEAYFLNHWTQQAKKYRTRPIVFDVGANEGDFTQMLLERCDADVYCFEPNPETAARLRARLESNQNVQIRNVALGERGGSMLLYDQSGKSGTGLATAIGEVFSDIFREETKTVEVPVTTLDDFVAKNSISRIDLLKIDTEGFEYPVLSGAQKTLESGIVEWIQFEFNIHNATQGHTF
jgi:FkbM family methyltransferase